MAQKTQIQYVAPSYVYGSEVPHPGKPDEEQKTTGPTKPGQPKEKARSIYVDLMALAGMTMALCMFAVLIFGSFRLRDTRVRYDQAQQILSDVRRENATLSHTYHTGYDLEENRSTAAGIGMIPAEEAERFTIFFSVPEPKKEPTAWDNFVWFVTMLLSEPKHAE